MEGIYGIIDGVRVEYVVKKKVNIQNGFTQYVYVEI